MDAHVIDPIAGAQARLIRATRRRGDHGRFGPSLWLTPSAAVLSLDPVKDFVWPLAADPREFSPASYSGLSTKNVAAEILKGALEFASEERTTIACSLLDSLDPHADEDA